MAERNCFVIRGADVMTVSFVLCSPSRFLVIFFQAIDTPPSLELWILFMLSELKCLYFGGGKTIPFQAVMVPSGLVHWKANTIVSATLEMKPISLHERIHYQTMVLS